MFLLFLSIDAAPAQSSLPSHWEDMKGKSVVLVKLTSGSNEYKDVEKEFRRTGQTSNIIEVRLDEGERQISCVLVSKGSGLHFISMLKF